MAIHPDFPGLTARVICSGKALPEYVASVGNEVVKYVEAQCDTEFAIRVKLEQPFQCEQDLEIKIFVDGSLILRRGFGKNSAKLFRLNGYTVDHLVVGVDNLTSICRRLRFANSVYSEERNYDVGIESIGIIKVCITYGKIGTGDKSMTELFELSTAEALPAAALERHAQELQVSYGTPFRQSPPPHYFPFESDGVELATFVFNYRSRSDLIALGIFCHTHMPLSIPERKSKSSSYSSDSATVTKVRPKFIAVEPAPRRYDITPATAQPLQRILLQAPALVPQPTTSAAPQGFGYQSSADPISNVQDGLTTEELIVMISGYRGHDKGLADKSKKSLLTLLKFYEDKDAEVTLTGRDPAPAVAESTHIRHEPAVYQTEHVHLKRESDAIDGKRGNGKRRKVEVIVLDD